MPVFKVRSFLKQVLRPRLPWQGICLPTDRAFWKETNHRFRWGF